MERKIYMLLVENAEGYGENGGCCYEEVPYTRLGLTVAQIKGYLSQLVQKGWIATLEGCYFSHSILDWDCEKQMAFSTVEL